MWLDHTPYARCGLAFLADQKGFREVSKMKKILYSSIIFIAAVAILYYGPFDTIHWRSDEAIIVGAFGVIALLLGVIFQTDGVDFGGGGTNNLWKIWLISYWVFLGGGFIVNVVIKKKNK